MKISRLLVAAALLCLLHACAGGSDAASQLDGSALRFVVNYFLSQSPIFPAGTVQVSPIAGDLTMGTKPIAKVELFLFGSDKQELTGPNFGPKDSPQLRYVFKLPETFTSGSYPCGTGAFISEVRVTDVAGFVLSKTFELCPGTPLEVNASAP